MVQAAQEGGFAAAGRADQADHVSAVDVDIDAFQHVQSGGDRLVAALLFTAVGLFQATDLQDLYLSLCASLLSNLLSSQVNTMTRIR